jgi:hypothetical protein
VSGAGIVESPPRGGAWEARAWECHAKTTIGRTVNGKFMPIAECSGLGLPSTEAEQHASMIVSALNALTPASNDGTSQ